MKFIKTLPYKLKRTLPILGIAGASLLAGCDKDNEPDVGLHDTVYTWSVFDFSRISPPTDICMSADSANVRYVILQNTDGIGGLSKLGWYRGIMEENILSKVTLQNQYKVRGRGELRGFLIDDTTPEALAKHKEDSLWLVRFGFTFKDPVYLSDRQITKQKQH